MSAISCHDGAGKAASDEELMEGVQRRDAVALSGLFDRYGSVLKALMMRIIHNEAEAEDLLMEIYMEIWHQAPNYRAERGKPLGWLVTLARRRAIDRLRKRQSCARAEERLRLQPVEVAAPAGANTFGASIRLHELHEILVRIIAGLPPAQQQAIDLAFFQGMSQREIAARTNIPLGTIKTRLELGLRKIADGLRALRHEL